MKSSIRVGPRSPALSEFWLSLTRMPWLVVRNSPADSSIFGVRSSRFRVSAPRPAPFVGSTSWFSGAFDLLFFFCLDLFLDWLIAYPFWLRGLAGINAGYRALAFFVRAFLAFAASSAVVTSR